MRFMVRCMLCDNRKISSSSEAPYICQECKDLWRKLKDSPEETKPDVLKVEVRKKFEEKFTTSGTPCGNNKEGVFWQEGNNTLVPLPNEVWDFFEPYLTHPCNPVTDVPTMPVERASEKDFQIR